MMFSSPNNFNDPYDCRPVFVRGHNPVEDRARIGRAWEDGRKRAGYAKPSSKELQRHISKVMKELSTPEGASSHFKPFLDNRIGVFCMSKDWRLLTQWAYYADEGKGLCLEYDVPPSSGFDRVFEVEYSDERPRVHIARLLDDDGYRTEALFAAVIRKAPDWAHEQEVRGLHMEPGVHAHPPGMLKSIMIGASADENDVQWLLRVLKENGQKVSVYRTALSSESFTLERHALAA